MAIETLICDWNECSIVARFHIEAPLQFAKTMNGKGSVRMPFSRSHHNVCAAHLDEYSVMRQPKAIYIVGKCPHCNAA